MKKIRVDVGITLDEDLEQKLSGSLNEVIGNLNEVQDQLIEEGWSDLYIQFDSIDSWYEPILCGKRLETDAEFDSRVKYDESKLLKQHRKMEKEKQTYLELKKKYEGEI